MKIKNMKELKADFLRMSFGSHHKNCVPDDMSRGNRVKILNKYERVLKIVILTKSNEDMLIERRGYKEYEQLSNYDKTFLDFINLGIPRDFRLQTTEITADGELEFISDYCTLNTIEKLLIDEDLIDNFFFANEAFDKVIYSDKTVGTFSNIGIIKELTHILSYNDSDGKGGYFFKIFQNMSSREATKETLVKYLLNMFTITNHLSHIMTIHDVEDENDKYDEMIEKRRNKNEKD